ncbi:MAG: deoxyguanosinetriphosphate triphosphohydrolase [Bacteroidales bacterium]|nr:deoxyguanosinetriphosphate triphosphohydrolase [Bacteroidales bacterium]
MMHWPQLLSTQRFSSSSDQQDIRSAFQRDYDRIIFSSPFRRLQNKTQVFPLPGSVFVHNRLTHSLEVASVGRSIARIVSRELIQKTPGLAHTALSEIDTIVSSACLAHDLGNPPFGHSGEKAISSFFEEGAGKMLKDQVPANQWSDLINFEGNANAFRTLTHQFSGRRKGGFSLTYATLASLVKYPYPSFNKGDRKKYGIFNSEIPGFEIIAQSCGLIKRSPAEPVYSRHPLVYLVEAADDISYLIMDMEDAHKLRILSTDQTETMLSAFHDQDDEAFANYKDRIYQEVTDTNERIAFLRATTINRLVKAVSSLFVAHEEEILAGTFKGSLVDYLDEDLKNAMDASRKLSVKAIYNHPDVVKIELTGFHVLGTLMEEFSQAILAPETNYHRKLQSLLPAQFSPQKTDTYTKLQSVLDFISGMTDLYAMQLYKDLRGIES